MNPKRIDSNARTLREHLRGATAQSHDLLDSAMRSASQWSSVDDYARFLTSQYSARASVELWLSMYAPAILKPPEQTPLIAHDLAQLGRPIPAHAPSFAMAYTGEATAIGAAWVLAGSSLGNRSILNDMQRAHSKGSNSIGSNWPHQFLSSPGMVQFWKRLRARVELPASAQDAHEASRAAQCVFEHFLQVAQHHKGEADLEGAL